MTVQVLELVEQAAVPGPLQAYVVFDVVPVQPAVNVMFPPGTTFVGLTVRLQVGGGVVGGNTVTVAVAGVDVAPAPLLAVRL